MKPRTRSTSKPPYPESVDTVDAMTVRRRLMLSQGSFARRYGFSLATLRNWEQRVRTPDAAARAYLTVIARDPDRVAAAFAGASREALFRLSLRELNAALNAADRKDDSAPEPGDGA